MATKKKPAPTKRYRVSRVDVSWCYVEATSPEEAVSKSGDGNADIRWYVDIGEEEVELESN